MECAACGKNVVLAKICPYCGARVDRKTQAGASQATDRNPGSATFHSTHQANEPRGRFRGALREDRRARRNRISLLRLIRYFRDPHTSAIKKMLILLAGFYILSPVDFIPGLLLPGFGWLDDVAVVTMLYRFLVEELSQHDPTHS